MSLFKQTFLAFRKMNNVVCRSCSVIFYDRIPKKKKIRVRKPKYLPVPASKLFRIPEHPYVPEDELKLIDDLLNDYYIKIDSLRQLFKEEIQQKTKDEFTGVETLQEDEANLKILLEENKKENERVKKIREEMMENRFQEKLVEYLQLEEGRKLKEQQVKLQVDEIVRKEKIRSATAITHETLEAAIERSLDNPINICYAIDVSGNIYWEDTPPPEFEKELRKRIEESMKN